MLGVWTDGTHEHELPKCHLLQLWRQGSQVIRLPREGSRKRGSKGDERQWKEPPRSLPCMWRKPLEK